ncbi:hypothetical protein Cni_G01111 [Canna indica]|uniref:Uncharacterized protein n=1 Tax=Canna indica TaxID=4628 RepID=A0AAQ3JPL0_9LILI|nr:hypothetical protein Cni_G01111 [Canna indica]
MAARNGRWQPAPVPTILNLPRPSRRSRVVSMQKPALERSLEDLLDRERSVRSPIPPSLAPATPSGESGGDSGGEDRWRFQAEILRAECKFLRMEREVAMRKLERNRAQMEVALRSSMETLVSGRKKIDGSESVGAALDQGIEELEEKLEKLRLGRNGSQRRSRGSSRTLSSRSSRRNFDRQALALRRRLEKMDDETSVKDIQEISVPDLSNKNAALDHQHEQEEDDATPGSNDSIPREMEMLRRKMEGLSRGMMERMVECSHLLSANNSSTITSSSNSSSKSECDRSNHKTIGHSEAVDKEGFLQILQKPQEKLAEEKMGLLSCCNCKEVVGRIMQQVRAESEQWSEMQEMLDQVRIEMEELRYSRDQWQRRAIASDINFHSQHAQKLEWKQKAQSYERKVIELQRVVRDLQNELQPLRTKLLNAPTSSPLQMELLSVDSLRTSQNQQKRPPNAYKEKEKHVLACHLKSQNNLSRRSPLQDIDNIAPLRTRR